MNSQLTFPHIALRITVSVFSLMAFATAARADIFQWEYLDDPSQGKRQSRTLVPDGAGVDAVLGANLAGRDLTMAYLIGADLRNAYGHITNFTDADVSQANVANADLTNANFYTATLTEADFTGADVRRADFGIYYNFHPLTGSQIRGTGLTLEQLYSTASYKNLDLSGTRLQFNNLAGGNFAGQNLTNASFYGAPLTDANFTDAEVRGASFGRFVSHFIDSTEGITLAQLYSTASYRARDLSGIDLSRCNLAGGDFAGQNLANASFSAAKLINVDFTSAQIRGASFSIPSYIDGYGFVTLITLAQLYSTASYQTYELSGISLSGNNLTGGNFAGQNLTNAHFTGARLTDADFTGAEIRGAWFHRGDFGTGLSLSQLYSTASYQAKDLRGIQGLDLWAVTTNLILPNGHIGGLNLEGGVLLLLRDYHGDSRYSSTPPIPIAVDLHFAMGPGGVLQLLFEADHWDSTISFAPGIPVTLGGTLELGFASEVNLVGQIGRTIDLFDWTGVAPTGTFSIVSPYAWDLSHLFTSGEVTLLSVPEHGGFALAAVGAFSLTLYRRRKIS